MHLGIIKINNQTIYVDYEKNTIINYYKTFNQKITTNNYFSALIKELIRNNFCNIGIKREKEHY